MGLAREKAKTLIQVTIQIEVPEDWIDTCLNYDDLFIESYSGYWLRQIAKKKGLGHLGWEFEEDERLTKLMQEKGIPFFEQVPEKLENALHAEAIAKWRARKPLPKYYHRLDRDMAIKMYAKGVERYGEKGWDEGGADANQQDCALQLAMLGEVKYG